MISFPEALSRVLSAAPRLGAEDVPLENAPGRVLAEDVRSSSPLPAFDYSAMDGYAIRASDLAGAGPWELPVVGESRTGRAPPALAPGTACRIFTGARIPEGADAIVMQEDVERDGDRARLRQTPAPGAHIRRAGSDLATGALALGVGARLTPHSLGLLAAVDRARVRVARSPRLTVIPTGDELRRPGAPGPLDSLPESNGFVIRALAESASASVRVTTAIGDDVENARRAIEEALGASDVVVTIGGASVGNHDVVRPALDAAGVNLDFWKVRIKPGKPLVLGRRGETVVLGLPGNPASAAITFTLFGLPLLRAMQGNLSPGPDFVSATLGRSLSQKLGRRGFYAARLDGARVVPLDNQASGAPTSLAWANALVVIDEEATGAAEGDTVSVLRLGDA